jgi:hypothetical protein
MPRRTRCSARSPSTRAPSRRIVPDLGGSSPNKVFSSVDLPAPLRPSTATAPRAGTVSETPKSTWLRP